MPQSLTVEAALKAGIQSLAPRDAAALEAEVLLAHVLDKPRGHLRTWPEQPLQERQLMRFLELLGRRAAGVPVAYLTGRREFWSLDLMVNRHTLIPRPETELLVELALARLPRDAEAHVADLGTGCGAIALAVASERPRCRIVATDICTQALAVARANAARLGISNLEFRQGSWFAPCARERFDLIVSNPPYVAEGDPHLAKGDLPAEPRRALVAGPGGMEMIAAISGQARQYLHDEGWLLLEHGYDQALAAAALLRDTGFRDIQTWRDAAGIERITGGRPG
jgi:release factor glutamine methyltransferase